MSVLIDTHALLWFVDQDHLLSAVALSTIRDTNNDLLLSAGAIWELSIKVGLGRLKLAGTFREWIDRVIAELELRVLPITVEHAAVQSSLPRHHGDPFDRLLVAQALVESLPIVTADVAFDACGVRRLW